ncbi:MAG: NACHT domain-containing protein [Leptolyngbya sp. UWPOB_LEPTO1]|uniref:NACHT C-terminal helical domain 2-containing protein n=1 Tax=Leptolyngbya sp. UWPOB_LEPTO1 TaxID=2815653 RepID=UPI001ACBE272|nr:NACHT domain-containing protein [Leptolyngbya sp. UWPOB_LEPTO1]MBN8563152.1 NACHT domain-containing protein [Leptolyngbya sp. UWPOB_LEPTO1]
MKPIEIFISYSHSKLDEKLMQKLENHLSNLQHQGIIQTWHTQKITAGSERAKQIDLHLESAGIILLLISSDFLASGYRYSVELARAMQRHEAREACIIPVILRPVDWQDSPFSKLQVLPTNRLPITKWVDQDDGFLNVVEGIRRAIALPPYDIEAIVQEVREKISGDIQRRCGTMRVLDMEQPITIDSIYTTVNILEKVSSYQRSSVENLLDGCDLTNFDRLSLGRVRQERIPGVEAVQRHDKLLILGKPGAGKTTFLKWLALQCKEGNLYRHRVPMFVTLKEFAEASGQPTLLKFLAQQLENCGIHTALDTIERLLQSGRGFVFLDGLDEVRVEDSDRILDTIRRTSEQFDGNQFVMTCRIAAKEYTFAAFTEVEIADFNKEQIADFTNKWFLPNDPTKAEEFPKELEKHPGLQELATNPLLLTLLCLVFEEQAGFPANRSELYKEGVDVLLKKWDAKRNIKREQIYKQLSLQRKEDLLSQVASTTFVRSEYFFKQKFVEEEIRDYIRNLPNASNDPEALQLDSEAVLKSIEAQHGFLVERARGIYSFSHLTFQEYFTARQFKEKSEGNFDDLVCHIPEKRWREIFILTVGMLKNADKLLQAMKEEIDLIPAQEKKLQEFLAWVEQQSYSVDAPYQLAAIRAFYFALALALALARDLARDLDLALALVRNLDRTLDRALVLARTLAHGRDLARDLAFDPELQQKLQKLKNQLPSIDNWESYKYWWKTNRQAWTEQLRTVMVQFRNIGQDWQFTQVQEELLLQYYDANKLLVDCLNSDCYVSREVRDNIETTLLLPYDRTRQSSEP